MASAAWTLRTCPTTLHVWLVPLEELRGKVPAPFEPAVLREQDLADTPLGRIVFYLFDCGSAERAGVAQGAGLLGVLGVRVTYPDEVAPPAEQPAWASAPWIGVYLLAAVAEGAAVRAVEEAGLPVMAVEGEVRVAPTPLPDAPSAASQLRVAGSVVFDAVMQGAPGQVENFSRGERYFWMPDPASPDVRWLDVGFLSTLWETEGRVDYAAGSAWDEAVGNRAYDAPVDHHAMDSEVMLAAGRGNLTARNP